MSRALIIVGHGSHLNGDSSAPVYAHAEAIRATGAFDEVFEAFWKEEPALPDALLLPESDEIFVVPLFLAEGYFTRQVLPRELGLSGPVTHRDGKTVHYLPPVGAHRSMADLILRRASAASGLDDARRRSAALVVIGHGTERSATSADTLYSLVDALRERGDFGTVACGFLDEAPHIADVLEAIEARDIVLVPFFVAEGWHTRQTIPAELGLTGDVTLSKGRTIWYTPPVGTLPEIADVILEMTGAPVPGQGGNRFMPSSDLASLAPGTARPSAPRAAFFEWMAGGTGEPLVVLQVVIETLADDRFSMRHVDDRLVPDDGLVRLTESSEARALARSTSGGAYRPLRSSADLQRGWVFASLDADALWSVLSMIYPSGVALWHRWRTAPGHIGTFEGWAARQTAMYAVVRDIDSDALEGVVATLCGGCLRSRLWRSRSELPADRSPDSGEALASIIVPCLEPCTMFATLARERATAGAGNREDGSAGPG